MGETISLGQDPAPLSDSGTSRALAVAAQAVAQGQLPPVHLWTPPFCGAIDMRIARDGTWFHEGSPIGRRPLVRLFSTILRHDADDCYYLVTPAEKVRITVDDAPFLAVAVRQEAGTLWFRTNVDDEVPLDAAHPLRVPVDAGTGEPSPYILVRDRLEALIARAVFYDLVTLAVERPAGDGRVCLGLESAGGFWELGTVRSMMKAAIVSRLLPSLAGGPRGLDSELAGNPDLAARFRDEGRSLRRAAVLVPLIEREAGLTVLLTKRTDHLTHHAGQVCLPGGRVDDDDDSPVATALRETQEEVGIDPSLISVVGMTDDLETALGFLITPVVGFVAADFTIIPNADEVADVFEVPLQDILDVRNRFEGAFTYMGQPRRYFELRHAGPHRIWGVTARILLGFGRSLGFE